MTFTDECKYCMKYLLDHVRQEDMEELSRQAEDFTVSYSIVKVQDNYWDEIAEGLRNIWPSGEKDGKYPWRDSKGNISRRLQLMWKTKFPTKEYTKEQILTVARKYVAQFEHDKRYMRTLKYFILKQEDEIMPNGLIKHVNSSILANMLESQEEQGWFTSDTTTEDNFFTWEGEIV